MRPVRPSRVSQTFADPGAYASVRDRHGPAGHHTGVDFGSAWPVNIDGRAVRAVLGGKVVISEYNSTMGNWVGVYNARKNLLVTYWHLSSKAVRVGERVVVGRVVGRVGNTGNSTAPHLHVQVNEGAYFDYHGHVNPRRAFRVWSVKEFRRLLRRRRNRR